MDDWLDNISTDIGGIMKTIEIRAVMYADDDNELFQEILDTITRRELVHLIQHFESGNILISIKEFNTANINEVTLDDMEMLNEQKRA